MNETQSRLANTRAAFVVADALRQMGVTVELITYPRVDHGPLGGAIYGAPSNEPWHGFDARQRVVAFFGKEFAGK